MLRLSLSSSSSRTLSFEFFKHFWCFFSSARSLVDMITKPKSNKIKSKLERKRSKKKTGHRNGGKNTRSSFVAVFYTFVFCFWQTRDFSFFHVVSSVLIRLLHTCMNGGFWNFYAAQHFFFSKMRQSIRFNIFRLKHFSIIIMLDIWTRSENMHLLKPINTTWFAFDRK